MVIAPAGCSVPAIHCLRAATGVALGTNQVHAAPSSRRRSGCGWWPAAMHMWQPAATAIFAARILVVMPPEPSGEALRPAMASISGVMCRDLRHDARARIPLGSAL